MDASEPKLQEDVARLLDRSRTRIRKIYLLRGLAVTLAVALAGVLAVMALDVFFTIFSDLARALVTFSLYALVVLSALLSLVRPLVRRLDNRRLASILDGRHPENKERLTTLVEIRARAARGEASGFSSALTQVLEREAAELARRIDPAREFTSRTIVSRLKYLVAAVLLLVLSFFALPNVAGRLFVRAIAPWTDIGNLHSDELSVEPGDLVVLAGEKVTIRVERTPRLRAPAWIRISRRRDGRWSEESAERLPDNGVYETIASTDEREWRYRISAGPAVTRHYSVRVCEMPCYRSFAAKVEYPSYTGLGTVTYSNRSVEAIRAVAGTRVSFALELPEEGVTGEFRIDGQELREYAMISNRTSVWTLDLANELGICAPRQSGTLVSLSDQPPTVVIEKPAAKSLALAPHAKLPLEVTASDDVGIAGATLRYRIDEGEWVNWRPLAKLVRQGPSLSLGSDEADLSLLDLSLAHQVAFDVTVRDNYPDAHVVTSLPVTVKLDLGAKSFDLQDIGTQATEARNLLYEARQRLGDAQNPAKVARDAIRREHRVSQDANRLVERALHEGGEARKRLRELSESLGRTARFRPVAERLERTAVARLDPALAALEKVQFASPDECADALERAFDDLCAAMRAVDRLKEPLEERVRSVEAYEQMRDLAVRQRALEEAARAILRERPVDTQKLEAWRRMEDVAARQARELSSRFDRSGLDEARRQMDHAAQKMADLKRELDARAKADWSDEQRARELESLRKAAESRRAEAANEVARSAEVAQKKLDEAMKNDPSGVRWFRLKEAMQAEERVRDALVRAERSEEERARQRAAFEAKLAEVQEALMRADNENRGRQLEKDLAAAQKRNRDVRAFDAPTEAQRREQAQEAMAAAREAAMELRKALARRESLPELSEAMSAAIRKADQAAERLLKARPPLALQKAQEAVATAEREAMRKACEAELARQAAEAKRSAGETAQAQAESEKARTAQEEAVRAAEAAHAIQKAAQEALDRVDERERAEISRIHADRAAENAERELAQVANGRDDAEIRRRREKLERAKKAREAAHEAVERTKVEAAAALAKAEKLAGRTEEKNAAEAAEQAAQAVREAMARQAETAAREAEEAQAAREAAEAKKRADQQAQAVRNRAAKAERSRQAARNDPNNQQGKAQRATALNEARRAMEDTVRHQQKAEEALADGDGRRAAREMKAAVEMASRAAEKLAESAPSEKALAAQESLLAAQRKLNDTPLSEGSKGQLAKVQQELKNVQDEMTQAMLANARKPDEQAMEAVRSRAGQAQTETEAAVEKARDGWTPAQVREQARQARKVRAAEQQAARAAEAAARAADQASAEAEELAQARAEGDARQAQEAAASEASNGGASEGNRSAQQAKGSADGQDARSDSGEASSGQANGGASEGNRSAQQAAAAAEKAAQAAERAAARQARALGMEEEGSSNGRSQSRGQGQNQGKGQSQGQGQSQGRGRNQDSGPSSDSPAGESGGAYGEISKLAQEMRRNDDPEQRKLRMEKSGWHRVQGAAKDGLGARELKAIPSDYRDLVRDYFLKLSQER